MAAADPAANDRTAHGHEARQEDRRRPVAQHEGRIAASRRGGIASEPAVFDQPGAEHAPQRKIQAVGDLEGQPRTGQTISGQAPSRPTVSGAAVR